MKYKTTKTAVMNGYARVYCARYCQLQHLLRYSEAVAYTAGIYGWNSDIFDLGALANSFADVAICTGYRPFGRSIPEGLAEKYNKLAESLNAQNMSAGEHKRALRKLHAKFLAALMAADNK